MLFTKHHIFESTHNIIIQLLKKKNILNKDSLKNLFIDSTMIKNICGKDTYGPNHFDRSKNGSKVTIVVTDKGIPLGMSISKSNTGDTLEVLPTIDSIKIKIIHSRIYADKGYISKNLVQNLKLDYKIKFITPHKSNQINKISLTKYDKEQLSKRNIVENFFSWFKGQRRIRLRYDSYIKTYKEFSYLALIKIITLKIKF
jgi:transposase